VASYTLECRRVANWSGCILGIGQAILHERVGLPAIFSDLEIVQQRGLPGYAPSILYRSQAIRLAGTLISSLRIMSCVSEEKMLRA